MRVMTSLIYSLFFEFVILYEKDEKRMENYAINKSVNMYFIISQTSPARICPSDKIV